VLLGPTCKAEIVGHLPAIEKIISKPEQIKFHSPMEFCEQEFFEDWP
jgi:hypothetical protein